jgi:cell division protein ZapA (FtsZ GTPase activity inhibitor)
VVAKSVTMDGTINITVLIAGRPYPLKIKEGDETIIRRIVKEVNDKIALFQSTYPSKDKQDHFAMALLTLSVDLHKAQSSANSTPSEPAEEANPQLTDSLSQINMLLSDALK